MSLVWKQIAASIIIVSCFATQILWAGETPVAAVIQGPASLQPVKSAVSENQVPIVSQTTSPVNSQDSIDFLNISSPLSSVKPEPLPPVVSPSGGGFIISPPSIDSKIVVHPPVVLPNFPDVNKSVPGTKNKSVPGTKGTNTNFQMD